ncbi:MAG TPA: cation:proton antiporter [Candidatus Polarisedimenticolaceae bacterium]|nr:cation:proton antiporter [Candidatus Polarisedimenticolaceae bacterium]
MPELGFLRDLVVVFGVALVVVTLLGRLRVPSIAGYIVAGILIGPAALGLVGDPHKTEVLAEVGVVLLLFGIGLELSLERIRRLWRAVLIGGAIQVGTTVPCAAAVAHWSGVGTASAVFLGFVVAVSSTAIVLRGLSARGELDAPHGRLAVGILIFQDLCVVPMMLTVPILAGRGGSTAAALLGLGAGTIVLGTAVLATRVAAPWMLNAASKSRQRDVFVLAVAVICLGVAWAASAVGVSVALGAFLAGLVVSGSEFRHQALADVIPLREVLASVFFVSVGMLLDPRQLASHVGEIIVILAAILVGKFALLLVTGALMRLPLRVCVLTGVALCQVGEFSFVLLRAGMEHGLVAEPRMGNLLAAVILSMLVTPFLLGFGPRLAAGVGRITPLTRLLEVRSLEEEPPRRPLDGHVVIAGYGFAGRQLARSLRRSGHPYVVVDLNVENVRLAIRDGVRAFFGDVTSPEVLDHLRIADARDLVLTVNDPDAARRAASLARGRAPGLRIIARAAYLEDKPALLEAGANEVVAAEVEAAVEISYLILKSRGADGATLDDLLGRIRSEQTADPHEREPRLAR